MRYFISEMNWKNKTPNREEKTFSSLFNVEQGGKGVLPLCLRSFTPMGGKIKKKEIIILKRKFPVSEHLLQKIAYATREQSELCSLVA